MPTHKHWKTSATYKISLYICGQCTGDKVNILETSLTPEHWLSSLPTATKEKSKKLLLNGFYSTSTHISVHTEPPSSASLCSSWCRNSFFNPAAHSHSEAVPWIRIKWIFYRGVLGYSLSFSKCYITSLNSNISLEWNKILNVIEIEIQVTV